MTASHARSTTAALLAAIVAAACGGAGARPVGTLPPPAAVAQTDSAAIARAQADSIAYPYTAADIHFMSGMISHHAQAILMAGWASSHSASAAVQRLAERIINAQQDEIVLMQLWLADRRQPVPEASPQGLRMIMSGREHVLLMPGMLSAEQLEQLDQARGTEFDRLFLTFMIQHHQGAVAMVKELFGSHGAARDLTVFKLASDINVDQNTEIKRMELMLAAFLPSARNQP